MPEARLAIPARRRRISLTSLIDMLFVLLMFFILSTTFVKESEIELFAAGSGETLAPAETPAPPPLFLQLGPETLTLNAEPLALDDLQAALAAHDAEGAVILVVLREGVGSQRLVDLLTVLRRTGFRVQVLG